MKLRPMNGRIVVRPDAAVEKTVGGIVLPASTQERPAQGDVVAVAEGSQVKVGEKVGYARFVGIEYQADGVDYLLLGEEDLVGVLEDGE